MKPNRPLHERLADLSMENLWQRFVDHDDAELVSSSDLETLRELQELMSRGPERTEYEYGYSLESLWVLLRAWVLDECTRQHGDKVELLSDLDSAINLALRSIDNGIPSVFRTQESLESFAEKAARLSYGWWKQREATFEKPTSGFSKAPRDGTSNSGHSVSTETMAKAREMVSEMLEEGSDRQVLFECLRAMTPEGRNLLLLRYVFDRPIRTTAYLLDLEYDETHERIESARQELARIVAVSQLATN